MDHRAGAGPVLGLIFYFFFGQNLSKQRIISRRTRKRITMQLEEAEHTDGPGLPEEYRPLAALLTNTSHSIPLYGSRITTYTDGRSKMEALLTEIACAKHHIHIQYYILNDDETGRRLRDALIAKAREGVEVRILYDDVGSSRAKKSFFRSMRSEGIEVYASCTSNSRSSPARSTTATTARSPSSTAAWASSAA